MAFAISTPKQFLLHSSIYPKPSSIFAFSAISIPKNATFQPAKGIPALLYFSQLNQWSGLKHLGISVSQYSVKLEKKGKCRGKGVYASLFGVGAPEALVIGVVALLVFGPKGLAEVARNLGKTLRAFQPTIRELQDVSREFKSTLEREIGLDDIDSPVPKRSGSNTTKPTPEVTPETSGPNIEPNGSTSEAGELTTDNYLKVSEFQLKGALERLRKEQEEERLQEEREKAQIQDESATHSSQGLSTDTPQASDNTQQETASSVASSSQNSESPDQETSPASKLESET